MAVDNPLTQEHLATMKEGLSQIGDAELLLKKAQQAGIDMSSQVARTKELKEQLSRLKQTYFPGQ